MASRSFDLVVIGTGSAATTVTTQCRGAGWQVAVVDSRPFGGTCALRGCDPKKVLVAAGEALDFERRLAGRGIAAGASRIDWPALMRSKRTFVDGFPERKEKGFADQGIAGFHGRARFAGPAAIQVGDDRLEARHVVIASGARPAPLGIPGEEHVATSDQFLELDPIPESIAFIGGGYISFEFAHVSARAGARVTILHRGRRPLQGFDPDLVDQLLGRTRSLGIDVVLEAPVEAVVKDGDSGFTVRAAGRSFPARLVVHGAGRMPNVDDLDLAAAGVERGRRGGVKVNDFLQSPTNPAVYAAGDAADSSGMPLTPVAGLEGRVVATNLLGGNRVRPNYAGVPSVVFTVPPLAAVGLGEEEARARGLRFRLNRADTSSWYSSRRVNETASGYKVLVEEGSERILGAHLLGPDAGETINLFALAIRHAIPATALAETVFAYPTHGSDVKYML